MDVLTKNIGPQIPQLVLFLLLAVLALSCIVAVQAAQFKKLKKQWGGLMKDSRGGSLEALLTEHLGDRKSVAAALDALDKRATNLERKVAGALRYVGLVRFDAFDDVGASQSFALAFFDENGDGAVITCLYGRNDCRTYGKILEGGRSDRSLTAEEQKAIDAAARGGKAVLSV
ncbi:MAG: DUF4446 family protein [Armatimonadetes bacterium]|nr:DUF4446 family protein [Armatimonadota bacterium]